LTHDFQEAFTKWQKRGERRMRAEGDYFELSPNLVFG
jgi:hypothetical protein